MTVLHGSTAFVMPLEHSSSSCQAEWLGMDPLQDGDLLWIARRGLKTPLPKPWRPFEVMG